jgi:serine protease Do
MAQNLGLKQVGGVIVGSVQTGSAADRAGIKQGDVIVSFNGQAVHDMNSLRNRVADAGPGTSANVVIVRDGAERTLNVKLDEAKIEKNARRDAQSESEDKSALGVSVAPLTPELADRLGTPKNAHGLVVEDVNPDGRAADAGIRSGDVIVQVNRATVQSVDDLRSALRRSGDKPVLLLINREGRDLFVTVRPANG